MKIVDYNIFNGQKNMDIDSEILEESIRLNRKEAVLRFYGWSPACVSLGRNQKDDFIDYNLLKKYGVDCVRRLTGGRALFHDKELTYSYVIPVSELENGENITESYKQISGMHPPAACRPAPPPPCSRPAGHPPCGKLPHPR